MPKPLPDRWIAFAKLMATGNYTNYKAALEAGYSSGSASNMASRLLKNDRVLAEIAKYKKASEDMATIDTAWVVKGLVDTIRRAKEANQNATVVSAFALLAKHTGGFDGGENAQTTNYNLILAGLTPEEVKMLAKQKLPNEGPVIIDPD